MEIVQKRAQKRIDDWISAGNPEIVLDLSGLGLTSLPSTLPSSLQKLDCQNNKLSSLPSILPDSLKELI